MISISLAIAFSIFIFFFAIFGYLNVPFWVWSIYFVLALLVFHTSIWILIIFSVAIAGLNIPLIRQNLITHSIMRAIRISGVLPTISETEKAAIEAGTVWIEGEFFTGAPNLKRLMNEPYPKLSPEIQAFLDGPVEQVCRMATDWEIYRHKDLPPEVWNYLKQERFFGMMIPKEYGGLGFSNLAYSATMVKLASRSFIHTATVGVTNSLGPAKLLLSYGTQAQKEYYLPRLARGDDIPCFALTEPQAGSDAASITSCGVVFRAGNGKLYLRLNFRKRYITLGAIATLIGLAIKLHDPDQLLGKGKDVGITCILVPANTPGVVLGKRHDPMGVPFYNSPIEGRDVIVPIDQIIGGIEQAGQGWKMLMQTLAAGRGISFPATCTGIAKFVTRVTSAYATVRRQFGLSIGRFEGIEAPLARIASLTYLLEAARLYTCAAVDRGERPPVVSAIAKYHFTELSRQLINDGMDILGGFGICRGPRNLLANIYIATPIPITVEGSNILTRSLMIFGQGAIRCHPYLYQEIEALNSGDTVAFDRVFWPHLGLIFRNGVRAILLNLSRGRLACPPVRGATAIYYRKLAWAAATFACLADLVLLTFGGTLKRRETLTGRFADVLSWMYLIMATLRRFEAEGRHPDDLPLVHWSTQYAFAQIQQALEGIFANVSIPVLGAILRGPVAWWWRLNPIGTSPSDILGHHIARNIQIPGDIRDRLTNGIYLPAHSDEALGRLEKAFQLSIEAENVLKLIKNASQTGQLPQSKPESLIDAALEAGVITAEAAQLVQEAERIRTDAIQVDTFTLEEYQRDQLIPVNLAAIG
ncbi:acyl-CoA dehydrogenase [Thermocoleostomius sinensis]|uniref:Acyl-coenzyme A dehydrogenase n=1 Tax=Thermocoleostomius sinensis A174 TaxID=2016057 RepID=A0A9E8ZIF8_9CYAN|nr:acyl-CoA dehydrogenase [Thermocoleostomius sinensis]WAL59096.1 acyl-CoA dehydrogenase [Thermocoleostomius sinensis A174]